MRLTYEYDGKCYLRSLPNEEELVANKLGLLENIEDKLDMSLEVFHRLMSIIYEGEDDTAYIKTSKGIKEVGVMELDYCKKKLLLYAVDGSLAEYVFPFGQYGKSWAFTREELV